MRDFAWVVPLPSQPKVSAVEGDIFAELSEYTPRRSRWDAFTHFRAAGMPTSEVEVVERKKVGVYDVAVLSASDSGALLRWLQQNGFAFPDKARPVLSDYIKRKWTFVALRIHPDEEKLWVERSLNKGTLIPLKFSFSSPEVVYPLKISSLNKGETEVLLYVFYEDAVVHPDFACQSPPAGEFYHYSRKPTSDRDRRDRERFPNFFDFERRFFRSVGKHELPLCKAVLPRLKGEAFFLSKLRNTFKTEEMKSDVVLKSPEKLSPEEQYAFVKRQVERAEGRLSFHSSLLLRTMDQAAGYLETRLETSLPLGWGTFQFLAYQPHKRALEVMLAAASHPSRQVRENLAEAISYVPDPRLVPLLRKLLESESPNVNYYACEALAAIGGEQALEILSRLALAKDHSHGRRRALDSLSKFSDPKLIETYRRAIENGNLTQDETWFCLWGLERIDDTSALPIVERVLRESTNERNSEKARQLLAKWKARAER